MRKYTLLSFAVLLAPGLAAQGRDSIRQRLGLHDLGTNVGVHPPHPQPRAVINPLNQGRRSRRRQAELRSFMTGQYVSVGVGGHAGNDAYQDVLSTSIRHDPFEPIDVVRTIDHDQTDAILDCHRDLFGGLGVAV